MPASGTSTQVEYAQAVGTQYSQPDLGRRILAAMETSGIDPEKPTREAMATFEEFHMRGREATRELAHLAGITDGMGVNTQVLDIGSGIGGAARTLAAECGCRVTGLDLTEAYTRTAELLSSRVGLDDRVKFRHGSALDMPFEDDSFDIAWMQHVSMNIEDKKRLFEEVNRVLKPRRRLALHEVFAGSGGPIYLPVPWADDQTLSFLAAPEEVQRQLRKLGFIEVAWRDVTAASVDWFRRMKEAIASRPQGAPPPLGLNLLMGSSTSQKVNNTIRNLEEGRIAVIQAVYRLPW